MSTVERAAGGVKSHCIHVGSRSARAIDAIAYIYENAHGSITLLAGAAGAPAGAAAAAAARQH